MLSSYRCDAGAVSTTALELPEKRRLVFNEAVEPPRKRMKVDVDGPATALVTMNGIAEEEDQQAVEETHEQKRTSQKLSDLDKAGQEHEVRRSS